MAHDNSPRADEILDKQFDVLDHGFVRLIDYMGSDAAIVQAARVSYGAGTKKVSEDRGLIRYLMRNRHTSPFEMVEFKFHVKLPIFVARQWIRHRTANVNELSGRYSVMKEEFYIPTDNDIRPQAVDNKQGRASDMAPEELRRKFVDYLNESQKDTYGNYQKFVDDDLARELARISLPLSMYTEWYWKIDLHNLFHFLRLRLDAHAQLEIRVYAQTMADMVKAVCPVAYEAFEDYILNAVSFSGPELKVLASALVGFAPDTETLVKQGISTREAAELLEKLKRLTKMKKPKERARVARPANPATGLKAHYDFTRSIQENALKQYSSFWNGLQPVLSSATSMSLMNQTLKASADKVSLSLTAGALSSILQHTNSQMATLVAAAKPSAQLAKTLSSFTRGLNTNIGLLSKTPLSIGSALQDVHKSMGCSAFLINTIRTRGTWDLKHSGVSDFMARLLGVGKQHDIFVNKTIRRLQGESSGPMLDRIMRSVNVEKNQMISSTTTLGEVLPKTETYSDMPPPCTLNLPEIQQNEILEMELPADSSVPSTNLCSEMYAAVQRLLKCSEAKPVQDRDLLNHTAKVTVAAFELPWVVADGELTFGQFIDHLYFLLYEGAGTANLRYLTDNGGVLVKEDCDFVWRLKHFRNLWIRHDVERGSESEVKGKKQTLAADLKHYGLNRKPLSTEEFRRLQVEIVKDMGAFVSTLEAAILKS